MLFPEYSVAVGAEVRLPDLLADPQGRLKVTAAFGGSWFWALLGLIFLPWTTLMFTLVYPIIGLDWLWLGLAVLADISAYAAGAARRRDASFYRGP